MFLGHATAADLLKKINDGLAALDFPVVDGRTQRELESSFRYEKRKIGSWVE